MGAVVTGAVKFLAAVVGFGSAGTGLYYAAVQVARIGALALTAKLSAPQPTFTETAFNKTLTLQDTVGAQAFVYGEDMVSGPLNYANTAGTDNKELYFNVNLLGHEIDSIRSYRVDDTDVALTDISGAYTGSVTSGPLNGVAVVDARLGTSTQTVYSMLTSAFSSLFGASHRGDGWAHMLWKFTIVDGLEDAFDAGAPRNLRAVVRGRKVYDPRKDTTQTGIPGSGAHRVDNPATWEWSDTPALCWADFMIDTKFGMREDPDRIDWVMVADAADICEATVAIPTASTQKRYTCNATFRSTQTRGEVEEELLLSMLGRRVFSQGKWKVWAGAAITPDVTLTEANLAGSIDLQPSRPLRERKNRVRGKYIDPSRNYTPSAYVEQRSSTYVTDDGGLVSELVADFLHCNNEYEAQRKAITLLKQTRNQRVVVFNGNWSCFRIQPGSTVLLDCAEYGFSGEKFFVTEWRFGKDGVQLVMVEENDSVWTDPIEGDYSTRSATGAVTFNDTGVPDNSSLTASSFPSGALVEWTAPVSTLYERTEIWRAYENVRGSAVLIGNTKGDSFYDSLGDVQRTRYYWVRNVSASGKTSNYTPNLTTTTATAYPLLQDSALIRDPFITQGASEWDFDSTTAPSYSSGTGLHGTDSIDVTHTSLIDTFRIYAERRTGPKEFDAIAEGRFSVEVVWRYKVNTVATGTYSMQVRPVIESYDSSETYILFGGVTSGGDLTIDANTTTGKWFVDKAIIEFDDTGQAAAFYTNPRYFRVGLEYRVTSGTFTGTLNVDFDMIAARIIGQAFAGKRNPGLVPEPGTKADKSILNFLAAEGDFKPVSISKVKTASQVVANTTFVDDNHLSGINLEADTWYVGTFLLRCIVGSTTPDLKINWTFSNTPQTSSMSWFNVATSAGGGNLYDEESGQFNGTEIIQIDGPNITNMITGRFIFRTNATTGGTLKLQWAQNTTDAANGVTMSIGSHIALQPIDP